MIVYKVKHGLCIGPCKETVVCGHRLSHSCVYESILRIIGEKSIIRKISYMIPMK